MFYFCHSENPSIYMKILSNSNPMYSWKKISLLENVRNTFVIRKINLHFFDVMKNGQSFPFIFLETIADSYLVEKWKTLEHVKRYVWKNLLNLDCQESISFGIFQVAWKRRVGKSLEGVFLSHFLENVLIENSNIILQTFNLLNF